VPWPPLSEGDFKDNNWEENKSEISNTELTGETSNNMTETCTCSMVTEVKVRSKNQA
jgi:hypothetical protein